ncbi:Replication factor C, subunit RFC4 [Dimargaris xerosporica]|nr:Replication factor C, subunit RFC4 [Dimargaris xerosporica]
MKILTKEQEAEAYQAHVDGGIRGGLVSTAVLTPSLYLLHRYWRPFRGLTVPFKAFLLTSGIASVVMIESERAGKKYEKAYYQPKVAVSPNAVCDANAPPQSLAEKTQTFVRDHQWSLVGGTWASGMAVAFGYLARQKHMSTMNKVVQARMYAQVITIAALLGTAVIVGTSKNSDKNKAMAQEADDAYTASYYTPSVAVVRD